MKPEQVNEFRAIVSFSDAVKYIDSLIAAERERCAKVADSHRRSGEDLIDSACDGTARQIAATIRALTTDRGDRSR